MAPVQSRLVVAVTIPAAALAIFLSLFWLRRCSKGRPPSPPDKQTEQVEEEPQGANPVDPTFNQSPVSVAREAVASADKVSQEIAAKDQQIEVAVLQATPIKEDLVVLNVKTEQVDLASGDQVNFSKAISKVVLQTLSSGVEPVETVKFKLEEASSDKFTPPIQETGFKGVVVNPVQVQESVNTNFEVTTKAVKVGEEVTCAKVEDKVTSEVKEIGKTVKGEGIVTAAIVEKAVTAAKALESESLHKAKPDNSDSSKMMTEEVVVATPLKLGYKETEAEKTDLSEKLANLELGTMKMGEVEVKERDSANHSPSENMLASPSLSNFSDAHSEGSSDSGKGQSDGTTSPSRTPAGGSSVSGDPSPSLYEFIIPQVIVGRLIGRHGVFLNEIMSESHTNIFIKAHPETVKLKICAIEGSQHDIEKALEKIRKKFPLRRYPKLTLERVSFVSLQPPQQLRTEDFYLQLIEGVNNDVILSSLLSPGQFFVQQPCHPSYPCLTPLTQTLSQAYSTTEAPPIGGALAIEAVCVCPSLSGWYRAQVVRVDEDSRHCDIKFVDYGGYLRVETCLLRQIRADFLMLPFQAVECSLANIQPIDESGWSEEARMFVHDITFGRILQAQVVSYTEAGVPLVNLYTGVNGQVVLVNSELVTNGLARYVATPEAAEDAPLSPPDLPTPV